MAEKKVTILQKNSAGTLDIIYVKTTADQVIETDDRKFMTSAQLDQFNENISYTNETPTTVAHGGVEAGETFDKVPVSTMLTKILYPYVEPAIEGSTGTPGGVFEKGTTVAVTAETAVVTKGSEDVTSVDLYNGATLVESKTEGVADGGSIAFAQAINLTDSANLIVKVTDAKPVTKQAVAGVYTFVYPFYSGVVAADAEVDGATVAAMDKQVAEKDDAHVFTLTAANQKLVVACPASYGPLASLKDQNGFELLNGFTQSTVAVTGADSTAQSYNVYVKDEVCTVSNYKLIAEF